MKTKYEVAKEYVAMGFSVVPGDDREKKPLLKSWKEYQTKLPTDIELHQWFDSNKANIIIITGQISDLLVIDIDDNGRIDNLPLTVSAKTGNNGRHYYFRNPNIKIKNDVRKWRNIDIRAEGRCVVAPPSIIDSTKTYEWINSPDTTPIAELPKEILLSLQGNDSEGKIDKEFGGLLNNGVKEGQRNTQAASIVGKLLKRFPPQLWENDVWFRLQKLNQKNTPPLADDELRSVFESICERERTSPQPLGVDKLGGDESRQSKAVELIDFLATTKLKVFVDDKNSTWAAVNGDGTKVIAIDSREFKDWIFSQYYLNNNKTIGKDTIENVCAHLRMEAQKEMPIFLNVRIAHCEDNLWFDLGEQAVKISATGWEIVSNPPILFKRFRHQQKQVAPERGGNIEELLKFINLKKENDQIVFLVYLLSCYICGFPHPVIVLSGLQGSSKSTVFRIMKSLVDPSAIKTLPPIENIREFTQIASHHWLCLFDNLSKMSNDLSDAFCRACTGEGFSKRVLYSDDDDFIYNIQIPLGVNGINVVANKPDLLDRSLLIELERISETERKTESELSVQFNAIKPKILGACFDTLVKAINIKPQIRLAEKPRMADWAEWGCAIAEALNIGKQKFLDAYSEKLQQQNDEVIKESPLALVLLKMFNDGRTNYIENTPSELLSEMESVALDLNIKIEKNWQWPQTPSRLLRMMKIISVNLEKAGLKFYAKKDKERKIIIERISPVDFGDIKVENKNVGILSDDEIINY
ncbi:MAG: bifunctional DNA primase/polymerase [Candidatus Magasanikbacteria bacterium]